MGQVLIKCLIGFCNTPIFSNIEVFSKTTILYTDPQYQNSDTKQCKHQLYHSVQYCSLLGRIKEILSTVFSIQ